MRWWERAVIAAWWTLCAEAAVVLFLVGLRGVEDVLRERAKRLAAQSLPTLSCGRIETAPAGASTPSGGLTAPSRSTREDG